MLRRFLIIAGFLLTLASAPAQAIYFPAGIDWANPSHQRYVQSLYLNALGRAPSAAELRAGSRYLSRQDDAQTRLDLFKQITESGEYRQAFPDEGKSWRVYRAPDRNYSAGHWRYRVAPTTPAGFERWELSGVSSQPVAKAMASYYHSYCYQGIPCLADPALAHSRFEPVTIYNAHACADTQAQTAQFEWIGLNGTTYPKGTDSTTLCMGTHYYSAVGTTLQRYECDTGYSNCQRNRSRDVRAERSGNDARGNPGLFFSDGSRLILTNSEQLRTTGVTTGITSSTGSTGSLLDDQHECANPGKITHYYQWQGSNGTSESPGVGSNIICMQDYYYVIEGMTLKHHLCDTGFTNCRKNSAQDVTAQRRKRVNGQSALQFRNGTTLSLLDKKVPQNNADLAGVETTVQPMPRTTLQNGQHACADSRLRLSQFRWTRKDGSTDWPDGTNESTVCMTNAYYEIDNFALRHFSCAANYSNCRASRGKDLIAIRDKKDSNGLRTLVFANGEQLALISR